MQGDGLSRLLFNCVLERVIKDWIYSLQDKTQSIYLGTKSRKIEVDCWAFADDVAILSKVVNQTKIQVEELKKISEKVGLNIFFEKTEFIATKKVLANKIETSYGTDFRKGKFKYLGEWLQPWL